MVGSGVFVSVSSHVFAPFIANPDHVNFKLLRQIGVVRLRANHLASGAALIFVNIGVVPQVEILDDKILSVLVLGQFGKTPKLTRPAISLLSHQNVFRDFALGVQNHLLGNDHFISMETHDPEEKRRVLPRLQLEL